MSAQFGDEANGSFAVGSPPLLEATAGVESAGPQDRSAGDSEPRREPSDPADLDHTPLAQRIRTGKG